MSGVIRKRIALLIIAVIILLALVPAFFPADDEGLLREYHFSKVFDQLYSTASAFCDNDLHLSFVETYELQELPCNPPKSLSAIAESRAPPA